jgi:hypothetical protein
LTPLVACLNGPDRVIRQSFDAEVDARRPDRLRLFAITGNTIGNMTGKGTTP